MPASRLLSREVSVRLDRQRVFLEAKVVEVMDMYRRGMGRVGMMVMMLSFLPLLVSGMFLGCLVIVGQASKSGFMQILTAVVLLSDVLFKIVATAVTEIADYALHLRVFRRVS